MPQADMQHFELAPPPGSDHHPTTFRGRDDHALGFPSLQRNITWFIRLRWIVVSTFLLLAALDALGMTQVIGLRLPIHCLLWLAGILAAANLTFVMHNRRLSPARLLAVHGNLWAQITLDLLALTVLIHFVGSQGTFAPFLFQVHITLACIFFARRESFLVLLLASVLYVSIVWAENAGMLGSFHVFTHAGPPTLPIQAQVVHVASAVLLWTIMWALVSQLSARLRMRQLDLIEAREQALRTYRDGQLHLRHTAHQMKAPLDAIHSQLNLIQGGYAGEVSDDVDAILGRIQQRCDSLARFVEDVLHLARLKSGEERHRETEALALNDLLAEIVEAHSARAEANAIAWRTELAPVTVEGNRESMVMMLDNLVSNAVTYSNPGGTVEISCSPDADRDGALVIVRDSGIGIPADKLPRIFDDYYRTNEAKAHNAHSTGVGLAIVRQVALNHRIHLLVESAPAIGTTFTLHIPPHQT